MVKSTDLSWRAMEKGGREDDAWGACRWVSFME